MEHMERFYKVEPDECMRDVRVLNGTGIEKLDNLDTTNTFNVLDRSIQNQIERIRGKLEVRAFNTPYYHSWTYTLHDLGFKPNKYAYWPRSGMTRMEHLSYCIIIKKIALNYDIKDDRTMDISYRAI